MITFNLFLILISHASFAPIICIINRILMKISFPIFIILRNIFQRSHTWKTTSLIRSINRSNRHRLFSHCLSLFVSLSVSFYLIPSTLDYLYLSLAVCFCMYVCLFVTAFGRPWYYSAYLCLFLLSLSISVCFCLHLSASVFFHLSLSGSVFVCPLSACFCLFLPVFICIYLSLSVWSVFVCLCLFLWIYDCHYLSLSLCFCLYLFFFGSLSLSASVGLRLPWSIFVFLFLYIPVSFVGLDVNLPISVCLCLFLCLYVFV